MISVSEVMKKEVITTNKDTSVLEATKIMDRNNIGCLLIIDNGKPIGIVTEKDISRKIVAQGKGLNSKVSSIMSSPLITVDEKVSYCEAAETMSRNKIRRLPVLSDGKLVGIITSRDLLRTCVEDFSDSIDKISKALNNLR